MKKDSWKHNFFTVAIGQAISLIGSSAVQFSLIWWMASKTASPMLLAAAGLSAYIPQFVLGPFVGVCIDRLKRKQVIIMADLFTGMIALAFSIFFFIGEPPYWSVCIVLGVRAIGNVFQTPAIQSVIPMLVPRNELVRANSWNQFMQSGSLMLGPVVGAAMYAILPLPIILISDLFGAVAAATTVAITKIPELKQETKGNHHLVIEMKEGLSVFLQNKKLCIITAATAISMIFYMPISSFFPLMSSDYFRVTAWHASIVPFGYAGGMMACYLLIGLHGTIKDKIEAVHLGLLGLGITILLCGILPQSKFFFWVFALLCALMGASGNFYNIPYIAYMQETIPKDKQGRAFSIMNSLMSATMPFGLIIAGPFAEIHGVASWFFLSGVVFIVITGVSFFLTRMQDQLK